MESVRYYVYDFGDNPIKYFDNIKDAIDFFRESNGKVHLGIDSKAVSQSNGICFDFMGRDGDFFYKINDYKNHLDDKTYGKVVSDTFNKLMDEFNIKYEFLSGNDSICGLGMYAEIDDAQYTYSLDKVPLLKNVKSINSCINEILVKNEGWIPYEKFLNLTKPTVLQINVNYVGLSGGTGQMDLVYNEFLQFRNRYNKEYRLSMYDENLDKVVFFASFNDLKDAVCAAYDLQLPYLGDIPVNVSNDKGSFMLTAVKSVESEFAGVQKEEAYKEYGIDAKTDYPVLQSGLIFKNLDEYYCVPRKSR